MMLLKLRAPMSALILASSIFAGVSASLPASAQSYPDHAIKLVVPFAAGTTTDIVGRELGNALSRGLGQPVVVDNLAGAGGNLGSERVAKGPKDGYNLVLGTVGTHAINPALYANAGFDAIKDFAPIGFVGYTPMLVVAAPSFPANNIAELIAQAKKNPGKVTFASAGNGTSNHLAGELLKVMAGADMQHVPYKNGTQALTDVMAGQVGIMFYHIPAVLQHVKAGKLKVLAIASTRRSPAMPDAVPVAEQGYAGFDMTPWWVLYAPAGTPAPVLARLRGEFDKINKDPGYVARLAAQGMEGRIMSQEELAGFVRAELPKWAKLVKESGARVD
jgi:tripartite-type tricarboxylate transporter receptor subunit TctC